MMMKYNNVLLRYTYLLAVLLSLMLMSACRKEHTVTPEQETTLFTPDPANTLKGMYLLNEGNMNMNKASLDYVDFTTGIYRKNIYGQANPSVVKGLGDVGNDIG